MRRACAWLARQLVWLLARVRVQGLENIPLNGPLLVVSNHLGDADVILGLAYTPRSADIMAKIELYDFPILGMLLDVYGVIWVHRGQPDRRALRATLQGLEEGRMIALAPEGRESLSGELEEGTNGAAYLALKSGAPLLPVTVTGTENRRFLSNIKRFRRTPVSFTVGHPFYLDQDDDRHLEIHNGTQKIMMVLAQQLPAEYRGVYGGDSEAEHGSK